MTLFLLPAASQIPDGEDGFSVRLMWRHADCSDFGCDKCLGEIYAYLPHAFDNPCNGGSLSNSSYDCACSPTDLATPTGDFTGLLWRGRPPPIADL